MPPPSLQATRYSVEDGIATITLHRPDKLNAYNAPMRDELEALFDETDADDAVRVVIVTGEGRAFCAGADLSGGGATFHSGARAHRIDSRAIQARGASADAQEGVSAFLEKRPAVFPNKVSAQMPGFYPWWEEPEFR